MNLFTHTTAMREQALTELIRPMPKAAWMADFPLSYLEQSLARLAEDYGGCNLTPDFQRGHAWSRQQQERFVEALIRGALPPSSMLIQFNCPHWENSSYTGDLPREIQCIDGLQRLTALRKFLSGDIRAFGFAIDEFAGTRFDLRQPLWTVKLAIHSFQSKAQLLQFYLDLNGGGTPHTPEELARVRKMLSAARASIV